MQKRVTEALYESIIDKTTDPLYWFISEAAEPGSLPTESVWRVYRVTVLSGDVKFAQLNGVRNDNFVHQASAAATLTYT